MANGSGPATVRIGDGMARLLITMLLLVGLLPARPLVSFSNGAVMGVASDGVEVFKGIPYARPPVGALRWHAPVPPETWTGTRDASAFGHACLQPANPALGATPSEDCLYLNVWRPSAMHSTAPVLVWVHGGGDLAGASSQALFDGTSFARHGLVFVSINYRLGRAGFFDHPALERTGEPTGNFAIMDMLAALRWVRSNVAAFGGDPKHVTVMGESSGAASVIALLISPQARGLFSQAIVLSGASRDVTLGGLNATGGTDNAAVRGLRYARRYGIGGSDAEALAHLRALPSRDLLDDADLDADRGSGDRTTYTGGEIVDGTVITSDPQRAFDGGRANYVPILVGSTSDELDAIGAPCVADPLSFFGAYESRARELYATVPAADLGYVLSANIAMNEPARYLAGVMVRHGKSAWLDRFGYVPTAKRDHQQGAPHGSDLRYDFDTIDPDASSRDDVAMADEINAYYANFALSGNPNGPGLPAWRPFVDADEDLMDFTSVRGAVFERDPLADRLNLIVKVRTRKKLVYHAALPPSNVVFDCVPQS